MRLFLKIMSAVGILAASGCASPLPTAFYLPAQQPQFYEPAPAKPDPVVTSLRLVEPASGLRCSGSYDPAMSASSINVPIDCTDGRSGIILFEPTSLDGSVGFSDATSEWVLFTNTGPYELTATLADRSAPIAPTYSSPSFEDELTPTADSAEATAEPRAVQPSPPAVYRQPTTNSTVPVSPTLPGTTSSRPYTGNCPTPESLDAAGRRCGARSAASRPGGYDGYGSWATPSRSYSTGGTTQVRGYFRKNGTYVRSHSRRTR